jgi:EAL domain-containing protein (putative c-di-GMP-specific phosphodiesterase class I)
VGLCHGLRMLSSMPKPIRRGALEQVLAEARLGTDGSAEPVEVDIEEAIANRQLRVWYQPQVELDGGRISGLEALVRLDHTTHGLLQPDRFLPRLRAKDHLLLTGYVLARVLKDHAGLAELGSGLGVSVNASMAMLGEADLMDALQSIWIGVPDRPRLTIEITEDRHSSDLAGINSLALRLKLHGIALSLDDFGAEYSSFHRLQSIGFSEMKLDKRYVTGCGQSDSLRAICQSTIGIARHLGLRSVAEGVESASDLATIREAGFDVAQGYYFCHPAPIEQLRSMLADGWAGAAAH